MTAIEQAKLQICQNHMLLTMANVLAELVLTTTDGSIQSAAAIHMLESADNLSKLNHRLIDEAGKLEAMEAHRGRAN